MGVGAVRLLVPPGWAWGAFYKYYLEFDLELF